MSITNAMQSALAAPSIATLGILFNAVKRGGLSAQETHQLVVHMHHLMYIGDEDTQVIAIDILLELHTTEANHVLAYEASNHPNASIARRCMEVFPPSQ